MTSEPQQFRRRLTGAVVPALAAAGLAGLAALLIVSQLDAPQREDAAPAGCVLGARSLTQFGGPIDLIDEHGRRVRESDFSAGPALIYFGYTHCPDVCPTTLYAVEQALERLGPEGASIRPIMVSVDPERDTPEVLAAYVETAGFPKGLTGLTGAPDAVRRAAEGFKVIYRRASVEGEGAAEAYDVDHSSLIYLMDRGWRARAVMATVGVKPADLAACLRQGLAGPEQSDKG